jgi:hypothetical protein
LVRFNSKVRSQLFRSLKTSFPDAKITTSDMEALAICLRRQTLAGEDLPLELQDINISPYGEELEAREKTLPMGETYSCTRKPNDKSRYYWVKATHTRRTPSGFKPFVGELAMARVTLDATRPKIYRTAFGKISPSDHLIDTVFEANQKYARHLGYEIKRLDLITPAREGLRFGAISAFLGYRNATDSVPSCYILEAGTATGQAKVLYLGKKIGEPINSYSGYRPTPFACPDHAYLGTLTVKDNDDPDRLQITSRAIDKGVSQQPYIEVDIRWELQSGGLLNIWPGFLIARAAGIVLERQLTKKIATDCDEGTRPGSKA